MRELLTSKSNYLFTTEKAIIRIILCKLQLKLQEIFIFIYFNYNVCVCVYGIHVGEILLSNILLRISTFKRIYVMSLMIMIRDIHDSIRTITN